MVDYLCIERALLGPWQFHAGLSISHLRVHPSPFPRGRPSMVQAKIGDTVKVHYTGRLDDGSIFDTSMHRDPLEFTLGDGELIPGFEKAVLGMNPGDTKTATIPAEQAYGAHRPEMVIEVDRHHLPPTLQPYVGQRLQMT
jgi:peptidylprolyl isomerase